MMNATDRRLKHLAEGLEREYPNLTDRARAYVSPVYQVLADSAPDDFATLRKWLRDARRDGLTHDEIALKLLADLYATVRSAEIEDECQIEH